MLLLLACVNPQPVEVVAPPVAPPRPWPATPRVDAPVTMHGTTWNDPYLWLEDEKSAEVQAWMASQNAFARAWLGRLPERDALTKRFGELYYVDAVTAPMQRGGRLFYSRTFADKEKAILYLRDSAGERVLIDPNGWTNVSLGSWIPSWDGKRVAFQRKPNSADEAVLHVIDVDSGNELTDVIPGAKYASPDWTPDGKGFYYEWLPTDPAIPVDTRPGFTELRYHALGTDPAGDQRIREKTGNPETFLSSDLSPDGRWHVATVSHGWNASDVYVQDLKSADKAWKPLVVGKPHLYAVYPENDAFYVYTNDSAPKYRVLRAPPGVSELGTWTEIVPEDAAATLDGISLIGGQIGLAYLKDVATELRVVSRDGKPLTRVPLPGLGSASVLSGASDQNDAYFTFSSFTVPRQVYHYDVAKGTVDLWASVNVPVDPTPYVVEQVWYPSKDGTKIPMFLVHHKDARQDGNNPVILNAYGGFNVSLTSTFRSSIYPWLERGGIYAVANLRGGGEFGEGWHEAGMLGNKQNVFDDFVAAGEYLVREGWTRPERLGINGGSNGGLLMGAATTQAPSHWGAVVCGVPLLDMLRYQLYGSGRTWIPEYGNAEVAEQFAFLSRYSPYQKIVRGTRYPSFLMDAADKDDRVDPMHARKFAAALQDATASDRPVLLRIEANAGHGGADVVAAAITRSTDVYSFYLHELGVTK